MTAFKATRSAGPSAGAGNVIAFNGARAKASGVAVGAGVWSNGPSGVGDSILGNSIFGNFGLGIDNALSYNPLIGDGDYRAGSTLIFFNNQDIELPNYPILSSAADVGGNTVIQGRLHNSPNTTYRIEFFSNAQIRSFEFRRGEDLSRRHLGHDRLERRRQLHGHAAHARQEPSRFVTATATNSDGTTSEFSARLTIGDVLGSVYVVNTASDHDDGVANAADTSLREAIIAANNHPGLDTIEFDIGSGLQTIAPMIDLPAITDPVIIDATTQPGYQGTPLIVLTGTLTLPSNQVDPGTAFYGLRLLAGGSTIRGLVFNDFYTAIQIAASSDGNTIEGCFIGTDATGTRPTLSGEGIEVDSSDNQIGGTAAGARNVISSNRFGGIRISNGSNNVIQGNLIGTDVTGSRGFGNSTPLGGGNDITLESGSATLIGGPMPGAGNVIAASDGAGIGIVFATDTTVQGNLIGTDITGTKPLGDRGFGIEVGDGGVLIGGTQKGDGNLISSNQDTGVFVDGGGNVTIQGNRIGTDITGTKPLGNGMGVWARSSSGLTIGGTGAGAGNLISGNLESGLVFTGDSGVVVQGNLVGTQGDAIDPLGNGIDGILLEDQIFGGTYPDSTGVTIGGTSAGAGNAIAFNVGRGVNIVAGGGISVLGNSLSSNGSLGIDLGGNGVTLNDDGDGDTGANGLQNFPVITKAVAGAATHVAVTLNSQPNRDYLISFYASAAADGSGYGEGQRYLGSVPAHTDASGNASIELDLPSGSSVGEVLSCTATDASGDTSEFSQDVAIAAATSSLVHVGAVQVNQAQCSDRW